MADLYASTLNTTILQIQEVPPQPVETEGVLCVSKLKSGVNEQVIRQVLGAFGTIQHCHLNQEPAHVVFIDHDNACRAAASNFNSMCAWCHLWYNDRPYLKRGWCCFEDAVSIEVLA